MDWEFLSYPINGSEMGLELRRLNMDSSWEWEINGTRLWVDPWLIGSEIEFFKWLSEQWHTTPPVPIEQLNPAKGILVTQSYMDHCHLPTLERLPANLPILASDKARKVIHKAFPSREVLLIPDLLDQGWLTWGNLKVSTLHPGRKMDPIYYLTLLQFGGKVLAYAPHGFHLSDAQQQAVKSMEIELLLTSFSDFRLPSWLGGHVNPGPGNVRALVDYLQPRKIMNTHDEQKKGKGLVSLLAKAVYPDFKQVQQEWKERFIPTPDYEPVVV